MTSLWHSVRVRKLEKKKTRKRKENLINQWFKFFQKLVLLKDIKISSRIDLTLSCEDAKKKESEKEKSHAYIPKLNTSST